MEWGILVMGAPVAKALGQERLPRRQGYVSGPGPLAGKGAGLGGGRPWTQMGHCEGCSEGDEHSSRGEDNCKSSSVLSRGAELAIRAFPTCSCVTLDKSFAPALTSSRAVG